MKFIRKIWQKIKYSKTGFVKQSFDDRDYQYSEHFKKRISGNADKEILNNFDLSVKDQGWSNACTGFATSYLLEVLLQKWFTPDVKLLDVHKVISAKYTWHKGKEYHGWASQDKGVWLRYTLDSLFKFGFVPDTVCPFKDILIEPDMFTSMIGSLYRDKLLKKKAAYYVLNAGDVDDCLSKGYPVVCGIDTHNSWYGNGNGIVNDEGSSKGSHAILVVGKVIKNEELMYKFINSWGKNWGDKGYGYIPVDYFRESATDIWTVKKR